MTEKQRAKDRLLLLSKARQCVVKRWCVSEGDKVRQGTVLCSFLSNGETKVEDLRSPCVGILTHIAAQEGQQVEKNVPVAVVSERCDHSVIVMELCSDCGMDMRSVSRRDAAKVSMIHSEPRIKLSEEEARVLANRDRQLLLDERKLALIVDLDQTLIHTSMNPAIPIGLPDVYTFQLYDHPFTYHCRLRPFAREFLETVAELYQLHIFTMGTRSYAEAVANILDPSRKYFSRRVLSRDELTDPRSKSLSLRSVFPCGTEMVAIIDDRDDVWQRSPNLVHVKPYIFFADVGDINAPPPGNGLAELAQGLLPQRRPSKDEGGSSHPIKRLKVGAMVKGPPEENDVNERIPDGEAQEESGRAEGDVGSQSKDKVSPQPSHCPDQASSSMEVSVKEPGVDVEDRRLSSMSVEEAGGPPVKENDEEDLDGGSSSSSEDSSSSSSGDSGDDSDSGGDSAGDEETRKVDPSSAEVQPGNNEGIATTQAGDSADQAALTSTTQPPPSSAVGSTVTCDETIGGVDDRKDQPTAQQDEKVLKLEEPHPDNRKKVIKDSDVFLKHLGDILTRLHQQFYERYDLYTTNGCEGVQPDLKFVISGLRQSVFKDICILFTGVIPNNQPLHQSREWNTAEAFGAEVHSECICMQDGPEGKRSKATTHIVVGKKGTDKLKRALKVPGLHIVDVKWFWQCAEQWKHLPEGDFPVSGVDYKTLPRLPEPCPPSSPVALPSTNPGGRDRSRLPSIPLTIPIAAHSGAIISPPTLLSPSSVVSFSMEEWEEMTHEVDEVISSEEEQEKEKEADAEEEEEEEEEEENDEEDDDSDMDLTPEQNTSVLTNNGNSSGGSLEDSCDESEDELAKLL